MPHIANKYAVLNMISKACQSKSEIAGGGDMYQATKNFALKSNNFPGTAFSILFYISNSLYIDSNKKE